MPIATEFAEVKSPCGAYAGIRDRLALTIIFCCHELCHVKDGGVHNFKKRLGTPRKVNESLGAPVLLIIFKDVCTLTHDFRL
jgi:hypothetical protein